MSNSVNTFFANLKWHLWRFPQQVTPDPETFFQENLFLFLFTIFWVPTWQCSVVCWWERMLMTTFCMRGVIWLTRTIELVFLSNYSFNPPKGQSPEKGTVEKKYMRFWNIAVVPLKINSITQLGLKDSKNILGQAYFYIILEFWSHLWSCHAAMFCCFFGIAFGKTMKYCVFQF